MENLKIRYFGFSLNKKNYLRVYFLYLSLNILLFVYFTIYPLKREAISFLPAFIPLNFNLFFLANLVYTIVEGQFFWNKFTKKQVETIEKLKFELEGKNINLADAIKNLEVLNTISNEITSTLNLDKVMNLIYKNVSSLMDVSFFLISTYDMAEESVQVKFCVREGQVVPELFKTSIANKSSLMALTIKNKNEILISDLEKEYSSYLSDIPQLQGKEDMRTESLIYIPLLIKEKVIGLFSVQSKKKNAFTKSDIDILRSLSTVIAVALNNADAYSQLNSAKENLIEQKQIIEEKNLDLADAFKNIEIVGQIGQKITSTLNLEEVIETLHNQIISVMDASGFLIYIYNPDMKCLELKYTLGKHGSIISHSIPIDSEDSFCIYSLKNKKEVFINDVSKEYSKYLSTYYWASIPDKEIIQAFINIPLIVGDNAFGVISVQSFNTNVYTKEHLEILKSLASFMSAALNNADTYSQLHEKNKEVMDSIRYAKRIQTALITSEKYISNQLDRLMKTE